MTGSAIPIVEEDLFSVVRFWEKLKEAGTASPTSLFSALRQRDKSTIDKQVNNRETNSTLFLLQGEL